MIKRHTLILILAIIGFTQSFCQTSKGDFKKVPWDDTTYCIVKLTDTIEIAKIIAIDLGNKASIFLSLNQILKEVDKPETENLKLIKQFLDSASKVSDTILINDLLDFDYLVSGQLEKGNARVFYKREKIFVSTVFHRLEKYGMYALRFFYLPDKRPFFSVMEYSGILEKGKYFSDRKELRKLFDKLSSERIE